MEKDLYEERYGSPVSVLVAKNPDGQIVGSAMVQNIDSENVGQTMFIHYLGSTHNETGVGTALLSEIAKLATSQGVGISFEPEFTSVDFWEKKGFTTESWNRYTEMPVYAMNASKVPNLITDTVSKGGQGSGRYPKGSRKAFVNLADNAKAFYDAGGTVEVLTPTEAKARFLTDKLKNTLAEVSASAPKDAISNAEFIQWSLNPANDDEEYGVRSLIAIDKNGELVGAMKVYLDGGYDAIEVKGVGSLGKVKGTGAALEVQLAKLAQSLKTSVFGSIGAGAYEYHEKIGRKIEYPYSYWSEKQCEQISNLFDYEPSEITKGGVGSGRYPKGSSQPSDEGRRISPEQAKTIFQSPEGLQTFSDVMQTMGYFPYPHNHPLHGGCGLVAQALLTLYPHGQLVAMVEPKADKSIREEAEADGTPYFPFVDHYAVQIGDDKFVDANGEQSLQELRDNSQAMFAKYWEPVAVNPDDMGEMTSIAIARPSLVTAYTDALLSQLVTKGGEGSGRYPKGEHTPVKPADIKKAIIKEFGNSNPTFSVRQQSLIRGSRNMSPGLEIRPLDTYWNDRNREVAKPDSRYALTYRHSTYYGEEIGRKEFSQMIDALKNQGFVLDPDSIDLEKCRAIVLGKLA